ncbi:helix-turn-helix domain-containing protein [Burkholderia pseudomallei]
MARTESIGMLLRALRRSRGLTQDALSKRIGLSRASIANMELDRQNVSLDTLQRFANALGYEVKLQIKPRGKS